MLHYAIMKLNRSAFCVLPIISVGVFVVLSPSIKTRWHFLILIGPVMMMQAKTHSGNKNDGCSFFCLKGTLKSGKHMASDSTIKKPGNNRAIRTIMKA